MAIGKTRHTISADFWEVSKWGLVADPKFLLQICFFMGWGRGGHNLETF